MPSPAAPIGIFDSGLGGLSVLRHVHARLPQENLLYFADCAYAPYGPRPDAEIVARTLAVAQYLIERQAKVLVLACNTATAAAIDAVRAAYPSHAVVGVEPGLKPAAALSKSRVVGVLATESTVRSARFTLLQERISQATGVRFVAKGCAGLADQVEKGELRSRATAQILRAHLAPLLEQDADTLVLGCTHYPFLRPLIEDICEELRGTPIAVIDTGEAVARQIERVLQAGGLQAEAGIGAIAACTTGSASTLEAACIRLLGLRVPVITVG